MVDARLSQEMFTQLCRDSSSELVVNHNTQLAPGFASLSLCLCSYSGECGSPMLPAGSFAHGEAISTSTKCTPSSGTTSPHVTQGILRPHASLPGFYPASSSEYDQALNSETSDSVLRCLLKKKKNWQY